MQAEMKRDIISAPSLRHDFWQESVIEYLLHRPWGCFRQGTVRHIGFVKSHETGMRIILVQDVWKSGS